MADPTSTSPVPPAAGPAGSSPGSAPPVWPWLLLFVLGRLVVLAALVGLLWLLGLPGIPGLLFALLLSMPLSFVLLRPVRDRLTTGLVARSDARRARKEQFRAQLRGTVADDG